ncbi:MAG: hypothetical protein WCK02_07415 [Bacteroidota bacterium]
MIYTIKIDNPSESIKLSDFLKKLTSIQVSIIADDKTKNPAIASNIKDFRKQIDDAKADIIAGNVISHEELKLSSEKW